MLVVAIMNRILVGLMLGIAMLNWILVCLMLVISMLNKSSGGSDASYSHA
jgi:hypothetical protein